MALYGTVNLTLMSSPRLLVAHFAFSHQTLVRACSSEPDASDAMDGHGTHEEEANTHQQDGVGTQSLFLVI